MAFKLTKDHKAALVAVKDGADVYDYGIAMRLREVERAGLEFVDIVRAMEPPTNCARANCPPPRSAGRRTRRSDGSEGKSE